MGEERAILEPDDSGCGHRVGEREAATDEQRTGARGHTLGESERLDLHALIEYRGDERLRNDDGTWERTTLGRILFNRSLPDVFRYVNKSIRKGDMGKIVDVLANDYAKADVGRSLDAIKDLCFHYAAKSGLTVSIDDVKTPPEKKAILAEHEKQAEKQEENFRKGIITDGERRQKEVEIWTEATEKVRQAMEALLKAQKFNPIDMMVGSGARGNMMQMRQIAGMRGLVSNARNETIPRPIKASFREGLTVQGFG